MDLIIVGAGGHGRVAAAIAARMPGVKLAGVLDDRFTHMKITDGRMYAPVSYAEALHQGFPDVKWFIGIGNNRVRQQLAARLDFPETAYASLVHPSAQINGDSRIGAGTLLGPQAVVNSDAEVGRHVIVNTGAVVEHDNTIGDYVHLSPNVTLTGSVTVHEGGHLGAGSCVIPGKNVGAWAVTGAGSTVIDDLPAGVTAVGTPAKIIKREGAVFVQHQQS
ncbi:acetyltransferase [Alkalicoccus chagannorensis]|uniref:acetyltransferase n=1 Tax=Alkalicoccus chagannorensis TaxID=427072 RepID=UPI000408FD38|nr:acetyltransferase [Alkalicoccus chagannorensis]